MPLTSSPAACKGAERHGLVISGAYRERGERTASGLAQIQKTKLFKLTIL